MDGDQGIWSAPEQPWPGSGLGVARGLPLSSRGWCGNGARMVLEKSGAGNCFPGAEGPQGEVASLCMVPSPHGSPGISGTCCVPGWAPDRILSLCVYPHLAGSGSTIQLPGSLVLLPAACGPTGLSPPAGRPWAAGRGLGGHGLWLGALRSPGFTSALCTHVESSPSSRGLDQSPWPTRF